jgi:hypothetical protein
MLLDILDDVFLLHLPLEPAKSALDRFALLNLDFSHATNTPFAGGKKTNYPTIAPISTRSDDQNVLTTKHATLAQVNADSRRNPRPRSTK